jgi:hypothetical protein
MAESLQKVDTSAENLVETHICDPIMKRFGMAPPGTQAYEWAYYYECNCGKKTEIYETPEKALKAWNT